MYREHQVTIGTERRMSPQLGDHVFVGAGARILGGVTIGWHSRIGANAVVVKDVPDHATAVGVPAGVLLRHPDDLDIPEGASGVTRQNDGA